MFTQFRVVSMGSLGSVLKSDSFPSVDPRVGWALTVICLVLGLLFVFGILRLNVVSLSGWVWVQVMAAQALTALLVGGAAHLSSRKRDASGEEPADGSAGEDQTPA